LCHHPLWDMDISSPPILSDITFDGKSVKAVAQPSKQGFLYVFDRVTGKPVWPMPEKPVEVGNVPGETYSPTQPIPSKPRAYSRNGVSLDDLIDFTPALHDRAKDIASKYHLGPVFTPPTVSKLDGTLGRLQLVQLPAAQTGPAARTILKRISLTSTPATLASSPSGLSPRQRKFPTLPTSQALPDMKSQSCEGLERTQAP